MSGTLKFLHMNQPWEKQLLYWIYGTKRVETLSKHQLVTRLYRSYYKRINQNHFCDNSYHTYEDYQRRLKVAKEEFSEMYSIAPTHPRFNQIKKKYEDYIDYHYESTMLFTPD